MTKIGVIGTGFVSRHFVHELRGRSDYEVGKVLTRRPIESCDDFPAKESLTNWLEDLIDSSHVVFECSGDVAYAASTIGAVLDAGKPVVTLNAEFHATLGSHFVERGLLTEAEGDQPGCLAALHEEAVAMGFSPLAYCNMKAFLDRNPTPENMRFWADKKNYSIPMVTSFTDGTKMQIEQALVANGLGAGIAQEGLIGLESSDLKYAAEELGNAAARAGYPLSDYILDIGLKHGVFIVARHKDQQRHALSNFKLGDGPYYLLTKDYCLVHLEVMKTIDRVVCGGRALLNNGEHPSVGVAAVAKRDLEPGTVIERGYGSFDLRGTCVNLTERPGHLPICLANDVRLKAPVEMGQVLTFNDVEIPDSQALNIWRSIEEKTVGFDRLAS